MNHKQSNKKEEMRFHRSKLNRKYLRFYRIVYNIESPYDVILDGNFIHSALSNKVDIRDRLARLLQGEKVNLYVTRSIINELEQAGDKVANVLEFAIKLCTIIEDKPQSKQKADQKLTASDHLIQYIGITQCFVR